MAGMYMSFPAMRGRMGTREYYTAMFPLGVIPTLFKYQDWAALPAEARAQRTLTQSRIPAITRYILDHEDDWVFSSLTASFDADAVFEPSGLDENLGILRLPLGAPLLINDGQHRRKAIEEALKEDPTLAESQTISVVLFPLENLERNQQMFSDLNRTVRKTSRSLDILYDHRDPMNRITLSVADSVSIFKGKVEKDKVSLAVRSPKFVTLSALYDANAQLLGKLKEDETDEGQEDAAEKTATAFWTAVNENIPEWLEIDRGRLKPSEARAEFIHCHAISFWALGAAGKALIEEYPDEVSWKARLAGLSDIDWRRTNPEWQGISMLGSDIVTRRQTRQATAEFIKWRLGVIKKKPGNVLDVSV